LIHPCASDLMTKVLCSTGTWKSPVDGGYTFMLLSKDGGRLEIGSQVVATVLVQTRAEEMGAAF